MSDEENPLYHAFIGKDTGVAELKAFVNILESHGYDVNAELRKGIVEIHNNPDTHDRPVMAWRPLTNPTPPRRIDGAPTPTTRVA